MFAEEGYESPQRLVDEMCGRRFFPFETIPVIKDDSDADVYIEHDPIRAMVYSEMVAAADGEEKGVKNMAAQKGEHGLFPWGNNRAGPD